MIAENVFAIEERLGTLKRGTCVSRSKDSESDAEVARGAYVKEVGMIATLS